MKLSNKKCLHLNVANTMPRSGFSQQSSVSTSQDSNCSQEFPTRNSTTSTSNQKQNMTQIIEGIYLGSYLCAIDKPSLQKSNITHIINCSPTDCPNIFQKDFIYLNIAIEDNWKTNLSLVIYIIFDFLQDALLSGGKVLVHCNQGISRSPSIVIAYIIYTQKISATSALEFVKQIYPYAEPNLDFQIQLNEMSKEVSQEYPLQQSNSLSSQPSLLTDSLNNELQNLGPLQENFSIDQLGEEAASMQSSLYLSDSFNSQVTVSTPDLPLQKMNYSQYKYKQNRKPSSSYNPMKDEKNFSQYSKFHKSRSGFITTTPQFTRSNMIDELEISETSEQTNKRDSQLCNPPLTSDFKTKAKVNNHFNRSDSPEGEFPTDMFGNFCLSSSNKEEDLNENNFS